MLVGTVCLKPMTRVIEETDVRPKHETTEALDSSVDFPHALSWPASLYSHTDGPG
jgi:hypothetical protein